jgi:hypothetical protein
MGVSAAFCEPTPVSVLRLDVDFRALAVAGKLRRGG